MGTHDFSGVSLLASLVLVQTIQGVGQAGFKDPAHPSRHEPAPLALAAVELVKCILTVALRSRDASAPPFRSKMPAGPRYMPLPSAEDLPLHSRSPQEPDGVDKVPRACPLVARRTKDLYIALAPIVFLILLRHQLFVFRRAYTDQATLNLTDAISILFVGVQTYLLLGTTTPLRHWTSVLLQIVAFIGVHHIKAVPPYSAPTYILLVLTTSVSALVLVATSLIYHALRDVPFHKLNLVLFTSCLAGYVLCALLSSSAHAAAVPSDAYPRDLVAAAVILGLRAAGDLLTLAILRRTSPFTLSVLTLLVASITPAFSHLVFWSAIPFLAPQYLASVLSLYAAVSHLLDAPVSSYNTPPTSSSTMWPPRRGFIRLTLVFITLLVGLAMAPLCPLPSSPPASFVSHTPMPHQHPPYNLTHVSDSVAPTCVRRPLPPSTLYAGPHPTRPSFTAFDDVLLVVFFSHPRYDINLDAYREVYSAYFPNILYIGPGSREDRGFLHSHDVVVDSYMAAEDFDADWFKMSGRMAHHMFYTAVKDYPCYAGYLWAPFDALLNVPRLMQFPQDSIWYHSPFAQRFVPNPVAVEKHPPAAKISERTPHEYAREAGAWGATGFWWWGEKHMGLEVCLSAYDSVPARMRARLEGLIDGPGHLLGGSADTMYLPGHLRDDFLDVLGTFLQTDCFLEIALPTTLHLILPKDEEIVWVDHWWKTPPPWNTTYVRDLWAEGYEVDSFHSFHWGDIQADGVFGPNKDSFKDMRALLNDSFIRQGIAPPAG
ncbi:hypothetical protein FB451DRAFT_1395716 [Mycena latifolia]|nr:hypothetical protein FB451DRAFT_1395716 [Mycena latifolia]